MSKKTIVIGGGLAGLSAVSCLAQAGIHVTLLEKNPQLGGRAHQITENGFKFDMGPSWYWMPDVFESFFNRFGYSAKDFYDLKRLDPSYRVFFGKDDFLNLPASAGELYQLFESLEKGSGKKLERFLKEAAYKYEAGMKRFVYKPGLSLLEFAEWNLLKGIFRLHLFQSISSYIKKYFTHPRLIQILEFPVLFLGAKPQDTPALYSLMNYADMMLGTWYPMGGMVKIIEAMEHIARTEGVEIKTGENVEQIIVRNGKIISVTANGEDHIADAVIASADYCHVEQHLLPKAYRTYSPGYWKSRQLSPSCLLFYLGINKKINGLLHHNLFFDADFDRHQREIYDTAAWPSDPLFYVCCPSKTDPTVAPEGFENLFVLVPVAVGLENPEATREKYFEILIGRLEKLTGENIREHIIYKKSYAHSDFIKDYNAFRGNAFGLANTLKQTAILKPSIKSKKVKNLYFAGQLTVPGPGMPPSLISGQVAATELIKGLQRNI